MKRKLNLLDVFCIASGAMISSGLFVLPGLAFAKAGPAVIASYFLAGVLASTGLLSQAELASAMPKTGGTYFYVTRSMGPAIGTVDGLLTWFSLSLKTAFAIVGLSAFATTLPALRGCDMRLLSVGFCALFVGINVVGIKEAGRLQVAVVLALIGLLVYYVIGAAPQVSVQRMSPFMPHGAPAVLAATGLVFVSYGGLLKVAAIAEEIESPSRNIPLGMMLSLGAVSILYTFVVFVTVGVLPGAQLSGSLTPIADGAGAWLGPKGRLLLSLGAVLAFVSTANAGVMAAARYPVALARDNLIPESFARRGERFGTPHIALITTGVFILASVFMELESLVKVASSVLILTFLFSCLSVIIMRESRLQNYQPRFRSPLYPWVQLAGAGGSLLLLVGMGREALLAATALVGGGLFVYWLYGRIRTTREYALLHLVERITSRKLTDRLLETELKEIVRERDDIMRDRFDHLIEKCVVLDVPESIRHEDFLRRVAEELAPRFQTDGAHMLQLLLEREKESSTVIAPGLAIPHVVVDGEHKFDLLLARCRGGIVFPEAELPVHDVFVLAGTRDERNFHLKALSAIAQIVQDPGFHEKWMAAKGPEALRDIFLLGDRMRGWPSQ